MINIIKGIGMWLFGMGIVSSIVVLLEQIDNLGFLTGAMIGIGAVLSAWEED